MTPETDRPAQGSLREPPARPTLPAVARRIVVVLLAGASALFLIAALGLLLLQQPSVGRWALARLVARAAGAPRSTVAIGAVRGDWITRLEARGLRVSRGDTVVVRADTLRAAYSLLDLLAGRYVIHDARIAGAYVTLPPPDTSRASATPLRIAEWLAGRFWTGNPVRIERLSLERCGFATASPARAPRAEGIELAARGIALGGGSFAFEIDTLAARFLPAGAPGRWCAVTAGASLDRRRLEVRGFTLASAASEVEAHGALALGTAPRDSITAADFTLRAPRLELADLGFLPGAPTMSGVVAANADLHGTRLQTLRGAAGAATKRARIGDLDLGPTRLDARIADGRVEFSLAGDLARAPVAANGWARPFDPAPSGAIEGRVERLPRSAPSPPWWNAEAPRSGRFRAALARGVLDVDLGIESDSEAISIDGALDVPFASRFLGRHIRVARTSRAETSLPGGSLAVDSLEVTLGRLPSYRVMGGRFAHLDLALWTAQPGAASDLNGTIEGRGRGAPPAEARGDLRLEASTIRGQTIDRADLTFALSHGEISLQGAAQAPSGSLDVTARGRPFDAHPSYEAHDLRFRGVDLGPWLASPGLRTRLDGALRFRLAGKAPETLTGTAELNLDPSVVNGFGMEGAVVSATVEQGRVRADARIDSRSGAATIAGSGDLAARPSHAVASGTAPNLLLARCLGFDSLDVAGATTFRIDADNLESRERKFRGVIDMRGRVAAATIDSLHAEAAFADGVVSIDTLFARSNVGRIEGGGRLSLADSTRPREAGVRFAATVLNAAPLASIVRVDTLDVDSATVVARLARSGDAIRFEAAARTRRLTAGSLHVFDGAARAEGTLDRSLRFLAGTASGTIDRLAGPGVRVTRASASVARDSAGTRFEADVRGEAGHEIRLAGASSSDSTTQRLRIATLDIVSKSRRWALAEPARITWSRDRLAIESFDLRADSGRVDLRGAVDRRGAQDLALEAKGVEIDLLTAWLGRPDLRGTLAGSLRLDGPPTAPHAKGGFAIALQSATGSAGTTNLAFDWDASRLSLDAGFTPEAGAPLTLTGRVPLALALSGPESGVALPIARRSDAGVDLRLLGDGVTLVSLAPLLDPQSVIPRDGFLRVDARLAGTLDVVTGSGRIDVSGGVLELPSLGVTYSDVALGAELKDDVVEIREAKVRSGSGSMTARGRIRLAGAGDPELDVELRPSSFAAIRTRDYRSTLSGDLRLAGTVRHPVVSGSLTFVDTDVYLTAAQTEDQTAAASVALTPDDYRMLEEAFGYTVAKPPLPAQLFYDASRLDVKVVLGGNTWVRQRVAPRLAIQLTGSFQLTKAPHGEPLLVGRIAPVPGRGSVEQFARQFDLAGGEILLNGDLNSHVLDVKTEYKVPSGTEETRSKVVVHLDIQGRLDQLKLILSSEPPLDQADIISYIVTGQTAFSGGKSQGDKSSSAATFATQVAMSGVTSRIEDLAQQKIGVDVVEVRQDGVEGVTLIAGQYVTPELYVGFRQPVGSTSSTTNRNETDNKTQYELNYELYHWLLVNLQGETSKFKSFIRARREY